MDYQQKAATILNEISQTLDQLLKTDHSPGLLGGHTGCALFYAYYYQLTEKEEYLHKVHELLLSSIEALSSGELLPGHCNGVAGIVWCIQHLINEGFADADMEDIFTEVDALLGQQMVTALESKEYDFLHEGLGIALHFLEKGAHPTAIEWLTKAVTALASTATQLPSGLVWEDYFAKRSTDLPDTPCFNLGLAHGMPAIIIILGKIYEQGIATEQVAVLLEQSINWLLSVRNAPDNETTSLFPVLVDEQGLAVTGKQSRMGWCYGDLGIGISLLNTGKLLQNERYTNTGHEILAHSVNHRMLTNSNVHDTCICHGSAGIAHIFNRAYLSTGDPLFLDGANKWLQHTIEFYESPAGLGFFAEGKYQIKEGLLEGISGVGLALIAALDKNTPPSWDRCILLS